ncbi:GAF domain-containing protein [Amnibacterium endophyticum]|uniref:GAF domain-containing protein n=1 Tax=Amnibacterium endophyticum TaxID=2109337 RepID=A0ABW4LDE9_9MICO
MLHHLLQRIAVLQYHRVLAAPGVVARDEPSASSGAPDALRVLLLGSGVASGKGVSTYGLALVGALQRHLQARLGRPVDVELVRQHGAGLERAAALARARSEGDWDAYVLAFGVSDALRLTPPTVWRRGLGLLLSTIEDVKVWPLPVPIAVAGIPPLQSFSAHRGMLMPLLARHAERLNQATRQLVAAHPAAFFVDLPGVGLRHDRPFGSPDAYDHWAAALAERLDPVLRKAITRVADQGVEDGDERDLIGDRSRKRLEAIADRARRTLDADFAAVRLIDGDRLRLVAASAGVASRSERLDRSIGALAMAAGAVVVADLATDPRTAGRPMLRGLRSYGGVALHAADGSVIGTLCVFNGEAGHEARLPELEAFAAQVEIELDAGRDEAAPERSEAPTDGARSDDADGGRRLGRWQRVLLRLRSRSRLRSEGVDLVEVPRRQQVPAATVLAIPGPNPIRVLTVGGEYAVGFGVTDRRDALDGAVARLLHRRTGRGVELVNRAGVDVGLLRLGASLGPGGAAGFDLVLWTPLFIEATRTLLRTRWMLGVGGLIRRVRATSDAGVVLVGVPALIGRQPMAVLGRARARQINRLLERIARSGHRVRVAEPAPVVLSEVTTVDGAHVYRDTAVHVFQAVVDALEDEVPRPPARASAPVWEEPVAATAGS